MSTPQVGLIPGIGFPLRKAWVTGCQQYAPQEYDLPYLVLHLGLGSNALGFLGLGLDFGLNMGPDYGRSLGRRFLRDFLVSPSGAQAFRYPFGF